MLKKYQNTVLAILSLIPTPLILFISTASPLYLKNQSELDYQISVLLPFIAAFIAAFLVGVFLTKMRKKAFFEHLLWMYYLTGPAFLIILSIKSSPDLALPQISATVATVLVLVASPFLLRRKLKLKSVIGLMAIVGALLTVNEVVTFAKDIEPPPVETESASKPLKILGPKLPNVYHLIIDAFQGDGFGLYASPEVKKELGGFTYYPQNISNYLSTRRSLPSFFTGTLRKTDEPEAEFKRRAFNSDQSLIWRLRDNGYTTYAYTYKLFTDQKELFDYFEEPTLKDGSGLAIENILLFMQVWAHSVLPQPISKLFIQNEVAEGLAKGKLFASTKEIRAHEMFLDFLSEEKDLPDHSRYTFIHIYPTHSPYVFEPDCSYTIVGGEVSRSSREAGYKCALQLISRFIKNLKRINRYENALIVIQADHGRVVTIKDGKLLKITGDNKETKNQPFLAHAKALLLIKPPGKSGEGRFIVSQSETMLVDLFPTIMGMLGIKTNLELDGISLEGTKTIKSRLRRFFDDDGNELLLQNGTIKVVEK